LILKQTLHKFALSLFACPACCNCPLGENVNRLTAKEWMRN
jgi:hypothetical protein